MAVLERDVVLMGKDGDNQTIDLPITCLKNVEDTAAVKEAPTAEDYLPIVDSADGGQMKKTPLSVILEPLEAAKTEAMEAKDAAEGAERTAAEAKTAAEEAAGAAAGAQLASQIAQEAAQGAGAAADAAVESAASAAQLAQEAKETAKAAATMEQVNAAIQAAVLDSWEGSY